MAQSATPATQHPTSRHNGGTASQLRKRVRVTDEEDFRVTDEGLSLCQCSKDGSGESKLLSKPAIPHRERKDKVTTVITGKHKLNKVKELRVNIFKPKILCPITPSPIQVYPSQ